MNPATPAPDRGLPDDTDLAAAGPEAADLDVADPDALADLGELVVVVDGDGDAADLGELPGELVDGDVGDPAEEDRQLDVDDEVAVVLAAAGIAAGDQLYVPVATLLADHRDAVVELADLAAPLAADGDPTMVQAAVTGERAFQRTQRRHGHPTSVLVAAVAAELSSRTR